MTDRIADAGDRSTSGGPDPDAYADFIGQIHLQAVWLVSAKIENRAGPETPEHVTIRVEDAARWEPTENGFRAFMDYRIRLLGGTKVLASFAVTYAVDFASRQPLTEQFFRPFSEVNLPVNTWPYLREFVSTSLGRMNWTPFTLPALKRGLRPQAGDRPPVPKTGRRSLDQPSERRVQRRRDGRSEVSQALPR